MRLVGRFARVLVLGACLAALPLELRLTSESSVVGVGAAQTTAHAAANGNGNGNSNGNGKGNSNGNGNGNSNGNANGNGNGNSRGDDVGGSARNGERGPDERGASSRDRGGSRGIWNRPRRERERTETAEPTIAGDTDRTASEETEVRGRMMVAIAMEMGAEVPAPSDREAVSGPVTEEMLSGAESAYVYAVQSAWEAHGFPWNDPDVLQALGRLDALISHLESVNGGLGDQPRGGSGSGVAADVNGDGFVDINDLWDVHLR